MENSFLCEDTNVTVTISVYITSTSIREYASRGQGTNDRKSTSAANINADFRSVGDTTACMIAYVTSRLRGMLAIGTTDPNVVCACVP